VNLCSKYALHGESSYGKWSDHRRDRFRIADLFARERYTEAILTFLETTDVGRKVREEEWEKGSGAFMEEDDELVEVEVELAEGGENGGDLLEYCR